MLEKKRIANGTTYGWVYTNCLEATLIKLAMKIIIYNLYKILGLLIKMTRSFR